MRTYETVSGKQIKLRDWCDHIGEDYTKKWVFWPYNPACTVKPNWKMCPICGKARPMEAEVEEAN